MELICHRDFQPNSSIWFFMVFPAYRRMCAMRADRRYLSLRLRNSTTGKKIEFSKKKSCVIWERGMALRGEGVRQTFLFSDKFTTWRATWQLLTSIHVSFHPMLHEETNRPSFFIITPLSTMGCIVVVVWSDDWRMLIIFSGEIQGQVHTSEKITWQSDYHWIFGSVKYEKVDKWSIRMLHFVSIKFLKIVFVFFYSKLFTQMEKRELMHIHHALLQLSSRFLAKLWGIHYTKRM